MVFSPSFGSLAPSLTPNLMWTHSARTFVVPSVEGALTHSSSSGFIYYRPRADGHTDGMVILELAGSLQLLLTLGVEGMGEETYLGWAVAPGVLFLAGSQYLLSLLSQLL